MERINNINIVLHIYVIKSIVISNEQCIIHVDTEEFGSIKLIFDDVWDCRFTIENGIIDRSTKMKHCEKTKSSIYEVTESLYVEYFSKQVSGTRPVSNLRNYILFDEVENVIEILSIKEPYFEKE